MVRLRAALVRIALLRLLVEVAGGEEQHNYLWKGWLHHKVVVVVVVRVQQP
jgi:hypothetical protein